MNSYDVVIAGAGLAGLTLARLLAMDPVLKTKRVLIIDRDEKKANDRTWCFWAREDEHMPGVATFSWDDCRFYAPGLDRRFHLAPYRYHMVRGSDYYAWSKEQIASNANLGWLNLVDKFEPKTKSNHIELKKELWKLSLKTLQLILKNGL